MELGLEDAIAKYNEKKISLKELGRLIKENGGEEGFWQPAKDRRPMLDKLTLEEALVKFNSKEITVDELEGIMVRSGRRHEFYLTAKDRNPRYPKGNNESRAGFLKNCYTHTAGRVFQNVEKKIILNAIDFAHELMRKKYDEDIYVYDDPRLKALDTFMKAYIAVNFQDSKGYKDVFMQKLVDIALGLCKEDIYYRARLFDIIKAFVAQYPKGFELTAEEDKNIEEWH